MRIYKDISLDEFEAWGGAVNTMDTLRQLENETGYNVFSIIESCIDDMDEGMDETTVNDILWFETDTIAEWFGYKDWEALEKKANGIEDEEEDEEIELVFKVGDVVNYNGKKGIIIKVDENDKDLPYFVQFTEEYKMHKEWWLPNELEEWEDNEE